MNIKLRALRDTVGQLALIFIIASVMAYLSTLLTIEIASYLAMGFAIGLVGYMMYTWNLTSLETKEKFGNKEE